MKKQAAREARDLEARQPDASREASPVPSPQGKRSRTRTLLIDTAVEVISRKGIDRASVMEVTELARVSNGAFYYHFRDKQELVAAVGRSIAATLVRAIDDALQTVEDGAERVACGSRLMVRKAIDDPVWGRLVVHALSDMGDFRDQISKGIRKDVAIGVAQGHFSAGPADVMFTILLAVVGAAIQVQLDDPETAGEEICAESILRLLGMSPEHAGAMSRRAAKHLMKIGADRGRPKPAA